MTMIVNAISNVTLTGLAPMNDVIAAVFLGYDKLINLKINQHFRSLEKLKP